MISGISLYLQGTRAIVHQHRLGRRYIPVPTGNSGIKKCRSLQYTVYPCTYRELILNPHTLEITDGISLYLQGTPENVYGDRSIFRYIPVPTGNSQDTTALVHARPVYPCTYRELKRFLDN